MSKLKTAAVACLLFGLLCSAGLTWIAWQEESMREFHTASGAVDWLHLGTYSLSYFLLFGVAPLAVLVVISLLAGTLRGRSNSENASDITW